MPIVPLPRVNPLAAEWLWPNRLAAGCLHLLDGDPGDGKSFVLADLMARLTTGRPWPDDSPSPGAASVLLLNAEDDAGGISRDRLLAAGADADRIHIWEHSPDELWPRCPDGLDPLAQAQLATAARVI